MRYLPVLWYVLALVAVLAVAGLGAAGNWRGALRYMRMWATHVLGLVAAALVFAALMYGITPSP